MQNEQDKRFKENLQMGTSAEDIVYSYLVRENSFVQDLRQQKHAEHAGPRLRGTEGNIVLPDFVVYNKNTDKGTYAVDVKAKKSVYPALGTRCFTVDDKFLRYRQTSQVMRLDFLMLVFFHNDRMFFYKDTDCVGVTTFPDKSYGSGMIYCFEYDESRIRY